MANIHRSFNRSFVFGGLIVAAGVVLLLDQQGLINADRVFSYFWPVVFMAAGTAMLIDCRGKGGRGIWGLGLFAVGLLLILENLGLAHIRFEIVWPLIIIAGGVLMIWRAMGPPIPGGPGGQWWERLRSSGSDSGSEFDHIAIFSGFKRRTTSKTFRGGKILTIFGGFQIDLRQAEIEGEYAMIEAIALMGGGEIKVPSTWSVSVEGIGFMGGYVDETDPIPPPAGAPQKRLVVKGAAIMGGVVVKN
ncbi:MAG: DUF5668 domain-containing protein [Candidatus Acidiferrales bacterium]